MDSFLIAVISVTIGFGAFGLYVIATNRWHERKRHAH